MASDPSKYGKEFGNCFRSLWSAPSLPYMLQIDAIRLLLVGNVMATHRLRADVRSEKAPLSTVPMTLSRKSLNARENRRKHGKESASMPRVLQVMPRRARIVEARVTDVVASQTSHGRQRVTRHRLSQGFQSRKSCEEVARDVH